MTGNIEGPEKQLLMKPGKCKQCGKEVNDIDKHLKEDHAELDDKCESSVVATYKSTVFGRR